MPLLTFDEAIQAAGEGSKHVLLGNGFSMAYDPNMFSYGSLFERANIERDFPELAEVFEELDTKDFERVMDSLKSASVLSGIYGCGDDSVVRMTNNIEDLKDLLIRSISSTHPSRVSDVEDEKYRRTCVFLRNFLSVFTTNYDLLLYWSLQQQEMVGRPSRTDGFLRDEDGKLCWASDNPQGSYYLHGAMHIYKEKADVVKLRYHALGDTLTEQVREKIDEEIFPIFVSEGSSMDKLIKIESNKYLSHCLDALKKMQGALFIHGHSFSDNDDHIWDALRRCPNVTGLYVSLFGDENSQENRAIKAKVRSIAEDAGGPADVGVVFYDAASANIW